MTIMLTELYDALLAGGTPEDKAREAATAVGGHEARMASIEAKLDRLATMMAAGFEKLDAKIDHSVVRLDAKIDHSVARLDAKIDHSVARLDAKIEKLDAKIDHVGECTNAKIDQVAATTDAKIEKLDAKLDKEVTALRGDINLIRWMLGVLIAGMLATVVRLYAF